MLAVNYSVPCVSSAGPLSSVFSLPEKYILQGFAWLTPHPLGLSSFNSDNQPLNSVLLLSTFKRERNWCSKSLNSLSAG
jgi:hypothetical protein